MLGGICRALTLASQNRGWSYNQWSVFPPNNHEVIRSYSPLIARATTTTTATAGGETVGTVTVATPSSQAESVKEMTQQCDGSWQPLTALKSKVFINLLQNKVPILSSFRIFMTKCLAFASICQDLSQKVMPVATETTFY